ncbi:MAG: EscU/YscU/HrcU family type III secretion system export apparatus switch protein [Spirochaetes bacterium]|nr:EscU/YscU/HrcU family type III secretion system export apparatus switch protein [Spirochaetota bacterium]MBU1079131.1 EscU/YscU/HrcU family type III secretion system export apparatus switch protein [Spirochaetota bacterium]
MPKRPIRSSVALRYDESSPAPIVVAKGTGRTAERIDGLAEASGVPVIRDDAIVAGLEPVDIGEFVPPEYWELVARVLAFIRKVRP